MNIKSADDLHFAFQYRILPLLQEYFHNDSERLHALLGETLFPKTSFSKSINDALKEYADFEKPRYALNLTPETLTKALTALIP